jgi:hypothetical protein
MPYVKFDWLKLQLAESIDRNRDQGIVAQRPIPFPNSSCEQAF